MYMTRHSACQPTRSARASDSTALQPEQAEQLWWPVQLKAGSEGDGLCPGDGDAGGALAECARLACFDLQQRATDKQREQGDEENANGDSESTGGSS